MTEVTIQKIQENSDAIIQLVGKDSYISWDQFTKNSTDVVKTIDELNRHLGIFRESQHKNFIQTMKKLKSLDLPDLITTVKNKKLPKQALRGVLNRFKLNGDSIELVQGAQTLKEKAKIQFDSYMEKNKEIIAELVKYTESLQKRLKQSGFTIQKPAEIKEIKATVEFKLSQEKAGKLASQVQIQYIPGTHQLVGLKTYNQIVQKSYDLIKEQYEKLTHDSRKKQRQSFKDHQKYLPIMNQYLNNSEALIIAGQTLLSKKVGLGDKKLQESQVTMMQRGLANNLLLIQSQLRAKIKQSIPATKDVNLQVAKEVIVFQTKMISQKSDQIKAILSGLQKTPETVQTIPMLLALILNDMVYDKYGYQEQDFMKNVGQQVITTSPQLIAIFKEMELAIIKLMQKLEVIPEQVGKLMEQSANQRDQNPQQIPGMQGLNQGGMVPPGMLPGNNPMDMLQMQQMQQMYQMQQMFGNMQPPK